MFQVRFKGFKGVLCIDPLLDELGQTNIIFRKSQKKFDEDEESAAEVEVVKYSMPSPVCLNRPLIMILDQVFFAKLYFFEVADNLIYHYLYPSIADFVNKFYELYFNMK